jgi:hypothetical protein
MKIDFKQIININSLNDLNKFKLDKPIFLNNYLFHYLIIFNKLDILKLFNFPIYKENDDGLNGFLLAAKYNNYDILKYFIDTYSDYIYNKNYKEEVFTNYLNNNNIFKLIIEYKKLNYNLLLKNNFVDSNDIILDILFMNGSHKELLSMLKVYKPLEYPLNYLILNTNLSSEQIIELLNLFDLEQLNLRQEGEIGLIFTAILKKNISIINFLLEKKINVDYYTFIHTYHPLRTALISNDLEIYSLIWNYIKPTYNYSSTNKIIDTMAHFILKQNYIDNLLSDNSINIDILINSDSNVWNKYNINKITPIHLLIKLDYNKYNYLLKNIQIDENILKDIDKNSTWYTFLSSLPKFIDNININFNEYPYQHSNLFQSTFKDIAFFVIYLKNKYSRLYLPKINDISIKNLNYMQNMDLHWADNIFNTDPIFPWFISYQDTETYWIHSNLNYLINIQRRKKEYDFSFCYLSLRNGNLLHANIIIYDFNNLTIERFDPYGDTVLYDKLLDEILEEELTWNTGFTYLNPGNYMPVAGFQLISDELNPLYQKSGDFGGYCLAWCTWYLEHRIINKNIAPKILVDKLIKKISLSDNTFIEYIRNYANNLNLYRIENLKKADISEKVISNLYNDQITDYKLKEYLINEFK